ncbi:MAG: M42 family metallopeptidase, partial [Candidatus Aureabacteria bacterium]|nr:M42 family metallopeptidase [Candidatus Auribacterota bacterium]
MMKKDSLDFLRELTQSVSPSGFEEDAINIWKQRTKHITDDVSIDVLGNVTAVLNKSGSPRIMLAGHIDEVGFMVKYIDKDGYIYFSTIGGIDLHLVPGQRVWIKTKKGKILGVIGKKPVHLLEEEEKKTVAKLEDLWIDIGINNKKRVESLLHIGDPVVPAVGLEVMNDDIVIGRGFDDKTGAFVISETLRILSQKKISSCVYGVATVQEEIGLRGAKASAYGLSPDIGIAVDVTFASDFPSVDKRKTGDIHIGKGPVIVRGPNIHPKIFHLFVETAKKEKIPYQIEGISKATGTDANVIQLTKSGIVTGLIS